MSADSTKKEFDIIVYGAASFVGQILCAYLQRQYGDSELRWAIAGRNADKLEQVKRDISNDELLCIIADAHDREALDQMVSRCKVVVSTVGPYALYGDDLVAACVAAGTDYCDLTGEVQWMQKMIDRHSEQAAQTGARIVHNCGFDSIPSDMGVMYTQAQAKAKSGSYATQIATRVKAMKGGASGGTIASLVNVIKEVSKDPSLRKLMQNPYAACPADQRKGVRQPNVGGPTMDALSGQWLAPFVMAAINTRVVHRSHALLGKPYGDEFLYDEATLMGTGFGGRMRALAMSGGLGGFMALSAIKPTRALLERFVLPKPGEGPSPEAQKSGFFDLRFYAKLDNGEVLKTKVTGKGDPGYGSTAKMLGEAAVCLSSDISDRELGGGFWTPSTAMGDKLLNRLESKAELSFELLQ